jgi:hypothetical protein
MRGIRMAEGHMAWVCSSLFTQRHPSKSRQNQDASQNRTTVFFLSFHADAVYAVSKMFSSMSQWMGKKRIGQRVVLDLPPCTALALTAEVNDGFLHPH